jgi:hypothetical protein
VRSQPHMSHVLGGATIFRLLGLGGFGLGKGLRLGVGLRLGLE